MEMITHLRATAEVKAFDDRRAVEDIDYFFVRLLLVCDFISGLLILVVAIVVGLKKRYAPIRYFAMTVFVVTIVKVFAIDLAELDRIYRVLSVIGLGVTLLVTSYFYQRSRESQKEWSG